MKGEDLRSFTQDELKDRLKELGEKPFRGAQIFEWVHKRRVKNIVEMTNLSVSLRERLESDFYISLPRIEEELVSKDGTRKYLFDMGEDIFVESVLMKYSYGNAICISTQAGCRMGCSFCASTIGGLERSLTAGEMAGEVYAAEEASGEKVRSIVLMGSGEPLDNYDNVIRFLNIINDEKGADIGMRHITLSTCGLTEGIKRLAEKRLQLTLAISLHAPNDEIRRRTMPIANKYPIDEVIASAREYAEVTGRRVTYEYALIKGVNDSKDNASELASRLKESLCHVNLIPVNDVKERNYIKSDTGAIQNFAAVLKNKGIEVTVRRELGSDINAACGQLRRKKLLEGKPRAEIGC